MNTPHELTQEMLRLSRLLDEAQQVLETRVHEEARAENVYRQAKSNSFLSTSGTVGERDAQTDKIVANERYAAHLASGLTKAGIESVRNRRAQLSAIQSIANVLKTEMDFARTGGGV